MKKFDFSKIKKMWASFVKDPLFLHKWDSRLTYRSRRGRDNQLHENIYSGYSHDPFYYGSDTHMFIEDVKNEVMPFRHLRSDTATTPKFSFVTLPSIDLQRIVIAGVSGRDRAFDITQACSEFIRNTTQQLIASGEVYYELIYEVQDGQIKSFSLELIPNKFLVKVFGGYYQIIPWWVAKKARTRAGILRIPMDKVLHIKFPKELGGRRSLKRILVRMYYLSKDVLPPFTTVSMKNNEQTGFDSNEYAKGKYLEIAKLTTKFGWNQRSRKNNYTTEFNYFKRYLDSRLSDIIFREWILEKLNIFLNRSTINLGTNIQMRGYTTRAEIDMWRSKMMQGGLKFLDMFNDLKDR